VKGGVYVYRTRKPASRLRVPLLSYHVGYVGETSSFYHRDQQHRYGLSAHGPCRAKPWADLIVSCYRIPLPNWRWLRRAVEQVLIFALAPVYNHKGNLWNPRRVPLGEALRQRADRDAGHLVLNLRPVHLIFWLALGAAIVLAVTR
jgi:hypothetical protein